MEFYEAIKIISMELGVMWQECLYRVFIYCELNGALFQSGENNSIVFVITE